MDFKGSLAVLYCLQRRKEHSSYHIPLASWSSLSVSYICYIWFYYSSSTCIVNHVIHICFSIRGKISQISLFPFSILVRFMFLLFWKKRNILGKSNGGLKGLVSYKSTLSLCGKKAKQLKLKWTFSPLLLRKRMKHGRILQEILFLDLNLSYLDDGLLA